LQRWEKSRRATVEGTPLNNIRGWYQLLYRDWCRGRKIIDIGCGSGIDSIHFAENGASVTFVDIVGSNVELVRRICRLKGIEQTCSFLVMKNVADLEQLDRDYDAVMGFGSLMHAPLDIMKPEFDALAARLKPEGGRFIMHSYPKGRWEREGALAFDKWGEKTDGEGTPWAEWYDSDKLINALKPARFELVYYCEYRQGDMNCIDLVRSAPPARVLPVETILLAGGDLMHATSISWEGASVRQAAGGLCITTGPIRWSYAAEIPLLADAGIPPLNRLRLSVKASVQQGEVGVGILSKDGKRFLVELRFDPRSDPEQLSDDFDDVENIKAIIVRNTSPQNQPSRALIEDVKLYCY